MKHWRKQHPAQSYPLLCAFAGVLFIPAWWLTRDCSSTITSKTETTKRNASESNASLLRSRSADGVVSTETTRHEKLKLLILRLLKSPATKSSVTALETLDKALEAVASNSTDNLDLAAWRDELRTLLLLGLKRGTQMQAFNTVSRLLTIYKGLKGLNAITKQHNEIVEAAQDLVRARVSTQWKQLRVLLSVCGRSSFAWLLFGAGVGLVTGSMNQRQVHYLALIQSAAFDGNVHSAWTAFLATAASQLILQLLEHISEECVARGGKTIRRSMQGQLFERLMMATCSYHDHLPGGAKAALLKDSSDLESGLFEKPVEIFRLFGELLPLYSVVRRMSAPLLLTSCIASPILAWVSGRAAVRKASIRRALTRLTTSRSVTDQMVLGSHLKTVRAYTDEAHEIDRYREYLSHHHTLEREELKAQTWSQAARYFKQISTFAMLVMMANMVKQGGLRREEFLGFYYQISVGWTTLELLYESCGNFWQSLAPAGRVLAALSLQSEDKEVSIVGNNNEIDKKRRRKKKNDVISGIEFDKVWFSYPLRSNSPVLRGVTFSAPPGSATAVVGASGSGKSTIMALLEGFYAPSHGTIRFDGVDVKDMCTSERRRMISYVSQDARIFPRSVRENVLMGGRHLYEKEKEKEVNILVASGSGDGSDVGSRVDKDVVDALKQANAWEFCEKLPNGLHTWVVSGGGSGGGGSGDTFNSILNLTRDREEGDINGDEGVVMEGAAGADTMGLSGGQSARVALARAILRNAPILLLDEAFSNLDAKSERTILNELKRLLQKEKRTVIAISHQLDSLDWVDQVVVVRDGIVVEAGTYQDLVNKVGGVFHAMLRQK